MGGTERKRRESRKLGKAGKWAVKENKEEIKGKMKVEECRKGGKDEIKK